MSDQQHNEPGQQPPSGTQHEEPASRDSDAPEPVPRGVRTMAVVRWAILVLALLAAGGTWLSFAWAQHDGGAANGPKYQCPMHPQIVSDSPGECPICHMNLEPISADRLQKQQTDAAAAPATAAPHAHDHPWDAGVEYICTMCPEVHEAQPGRCPKCGMDLVPDVKKPAPAGSAPSTAGSAPAGPGGEHSRHAPVQQAAPTGEAHRATPPGSIPVGTTEVALALDRVQAIGVRTAIVEEKAASSSLRATAVVSAPEQNVAEVHVRAAGFVEGISVRETGVTVKAGQALVSIYSPEVYQAQSELLATREWGLLSDAGGPVRGEGARRKLELLGVSQKTADKVLATGKPFRNIGISAPIGGVITKKNVVLGSYVTPEMTLYEIVDLSKVYIVADLYQQNMERVAVGTVGRFKSASRKEATAEAKVDLIYPQVNLEARTTRVRMQVQNPQLALLPGEFGYVEFVGPAQTALVVPRDALIDTGEQQYVFVEGQPGVFTPRVVRVGAEVGETIELLEGVKKGDKVVSGATFLLDSESRLQASLSSAGPEAAPVSLSCEAHFDGAKYPDKLLECRKCEQAHAGMGSMVDDCKKAIPQPWK